MVYYVLALRNRRSGDFHKRYILVASAVGLGAAVFRVLLSLVGPNQWNIPAGLLLTNAFIVAGMFHDRITLGRVHRVYRIALPVCIAVELLTLALPHTAPGQALLNLLAATGEFLAFLYG